METIFLTGFMGSGKTTIGRALGRRLALTVFDTDALIESALAKSIPEIFAEEGETAFRRYETNVLKKVAWDNVIVTTGGGIVMNRRNREWMKNHGTVIYLHGAPEELFRRISQDPNRPLARDKTLKDMKTLFQKRLPLYKEADYTIETDGKTVDDIVEKIAGLLINEQVCWI
ncbi:MAG TPA: shikimate kinase [Bacillales bacterium]|nr:shikimate kinase [Bacillales bacterium]